MYHKIPDTAIVVVNPMIAANQSLKVTLSKFLRVIRPCYQSITVVGGNLSVEQDITDVNLRSYPILRAKSKIKRIFDNLRLQFKMMSWIFKTAHHETSVFFWIADKMVLPFIAAKIKKAETNYFVYGNMTIEGNTSYFTRYSAALICKMAHHSDFVCIESPSVINNWPALKSHKYKIIHLYTANLLFSDIECRETVLGMVCRLTEGKHVLECIQAMQQIHNKYPDWTLEIVGTGKQQQACMNMIEQCHAETYITMFGWLEHKQVMEQAKRWKYLLFPTDTEGLPNSLIEIMGLGIPAISNAVGGVPDIIVDGINGLLLSGTSIESIRLCIERSINIPTQVYQQMSKAAFDTISGEYSLMTASKRAERSLL